MTEKHKLKLAVVCSSNMNRSMEAHASLQKKGFNIESYGVGDKVKIPGPNPREPNSYPFGITYGEIYDDLVKKDKKLYTENGMLHILERNRRIKQRPERLQTSNKMFDLILTVEERVYDILTESFQERESDLEQPVHVINMDVLDNPEDATIGAFLLVELVQLLIQCEDIDNEIEDLLQDFEVKCKRTLLHTVLFY